MMDHETVWGLTNIVTNGEVPEPTEGTGGVIVKMNKDDPGNFEIIFECDDPFRHVAAYEDDLYFATKTAVHCFVDNVAPKISMKFRKELEEEIM